MRKIFTSDSLSIEDLELITKNLSKREGRSNFSTVLCQSTFRDNNHQILSLESYKDLQKLIFTALSYSEDNQSDYEFIRSIIKSTFFYYK